MKQYNTSSLDYILTMQRMDNKTDTRPDLVMSGSYGKPLSKLCLFKRKIKNFLRRN